MEDENFRKIFVGGLHYATTDESLKKFYEQWGEVVDCIVMRDQMTKKSRGFGFVTFSESRMIDECLKARPHKIDGKDVECKRAMPREGMSQALQELHVTSNKLFVGSIKDEMQEEHLREYFSQFGAITSIDIVTDRATGKRRGFAFVTFEDYDPVDKVILIAEHEICGSKIGVKKALEREQKEIIAAGGSVVRGRGRGGRGAPPVRGIRGTGVRGGARGGAVAAAAAAGGYYNGSGGYSAPGAGGFGGYDADNYGGGYSDGWNQGGAATGGYGGWQQGGAAAGGWNQGYGDTGYGQGIGAAGAGTGGNFGSGYGAGYGGGAMKGPGYSQRAAGPYGGGFGRGGGAAAAPGFGGAAPYGAGYGAN